MLSTVVFPAPLGPITETISPFWTSRLTLVTACTPPNAFETSRISTSALIRRSGPRTRGARSREPSLPPAVVLDVAVALPLPDAREPLMKPFQSPFLPRLPAAAAKQNVPVSIQQPLVRHRRP